MLRLDFIMRERGITQTEISRKMNVSRVTVNRVIRGALPVYPKYRDGFAKALDWPLDRADELFDEVKIDE